MHITLALMGLFASMMCHPTCASICLPRHTRRRRGSTPARRGRAPVARGDRPTRSWAGFPRWTKARSPSKTLGGSKPVTAGAPPCAEAARPKRSDLKSGGRPVLGRGAGACKAPKRHDTSCNSEQEPQRKRVCAWNCVIRLETCEVLLTPKRYRQMRRILIPH